MGWFLNLVKPKIQSGSESNIPANLWKSCPNCTEMIYSKEWEASLYVCPKCDFHERIGAMTRIHLLADSTPELIELPSIKEDILKFKDTINYKDRIIDARKKTKLQDSAIVAEININNNKVIIFVMDFNFIGGSMGAHLGSAFLKAVEIAVLKKVPLIVVTASGGARMQEGIISLMQMPKTVFACEILLEQKIPYIVVLSDPTTGGVIASFAMLGDITLAEPNALIGFTGPRVIEETMQIKLDVNFQKSEFQLKHGFIDMIVHRSLLKEKLAIIIDNLTMNKDKQ